MTQKPILLTLLALLFFHFSSATHYRGSEITYTHVSDMKYTFTLKIYRNCQGTSFSNPSSTTYIRNKSGTVKQGVSLTRTSIKDVSNSCNPKFSCSPSNTQVSQHGIEQHVYEATIDFSKKPYDKFGKSGPIYFVFDFCCRMNTIDNGSANSVAYNFAMLDLRYGGNSTPEILSENLTTACCNQPVYYSVAAHSEEDGDSVSYAMVNPWKGFRDSVKLTPGVVSAYYPGSLKYPYKNADANPPIGTSFDHTTGSLVFTPIKCDEVANMVFEVTSWRKDTFGTWQRSAVTRREQVVEVFRCARNNPPEIRLSYSDGVACVGGTFKQVIEIQDKVKKPPPPDTVPPPDKITIEILDSLPGATYQWSGTTSPNEDTLTVLWSPDSSQIRSKPYSLTLKVKDNACPRSAITYKTFNVPVYPALDGSTKVVDLGCNRFSLEGQINSGLTGVKYVWNVKDTAGNILDRNKVYFQNAQAATSRRSLDTLILREPGTYILHGQMHKNTPCTYDSYDTITVTSQVQPLFSKKQGVACGTDTINLKQDLYPMSKFTSFRWSTGNTDSVLKYGFPKGVSGSMSFELFAYPDTGCFYFDTKQINKSESPTIHHAYHNGGLCSPIDHELSIRVEPVGDTATIRWGSTVKRTHRITKGGSYPVSAQNSCGVVYDTIQVEEWFKPDFDLTANGFYFCDTNYRKLISGLKNPVPNPTYQWDGWYWRDTFGITDYNWHKLEMRNVCGSKTDSIRMVGRKDTPRPKLGKDTTVCHGNPVQFTLPKKDGWISWSTGDNHIVTTTTAPDTLWVSVINECGTGEDTVILERLNPPVREIPEDTFYCAGDSILLNAGNHGATYNWLGRANTSQTLNIQAGGTYRVVVRNLCGADTFTSNVVQREAPQVDLGADLSVTDSVLLDARNHGSRYVWSTGDTSRIITVKQSQTVWVEVSNACGSDRDSINLKFLNVPKLSGINVKVYPNPSKGVVWIEAPADVTISNVMAFNAIGQRLKPQVEETPEGRLKLQFTPTNQVIFLRLKTNLGDYQVPIILN
ncbi:MAG: hypothetical protein JJ975_06350, partial [Bacteroidia bacterium]|nr:hypothetical protein [Bacteroidia bacterium]